MRMNSLHAAPSLAAPRLRALFAALLWGLVEVVALWRSRAAPRR